jgi:membrane-bound metal-dependent hydrolase YbcI (DUF457 family)
MLPKIPHARNMIKDLLAVSGAYSFQKLITASILFFIKPPLSKTKYKASIIRCEKYAKIKREATASLKV